MPDLKIAIMHYSSAPVVGGVESVIREHSRLFAQAGYSVKIFSGRGKKVDPDVQFEKFGLLNSSSAEILEIKEHLDRGDIPESFEPVKKKILTFLNDALGGFDTIIAHNICSLHKNLPLTAALFDFLQSHPSTQLISWDHDLAWTNEQYLDELYERYPWNLLKKTWQPERHRHVTVSEMRKKELESLLDGQTDEVLSIPSGTDWQGLLNLEEQALEIIDSYQLMDAFPVLFLPARITRRKNIELAISITASLRSYYPSAALVVSGPLGPHNPKNKSYLEQLKGQTKSLGLDLPSQRGKAKVVFLADFSDDFLPMQTINGLYRFVDALLFPSFQEGFGIPILEAGIVGMPIFCSDIPPFHETAGEMAAYFDPHGDPDTIAEDIHKTIQRNPAIIHKTHVKRNYTWNNIFTKRIEPLILKE